ncbi:bifunctional DNA primase/polymerase [Streptomyces sp. NPDC055085]
MPAELRVSDSDSCHSLSGEWVATAVETASWCARRGWPVHPLAAGRKTPVANCIRCRTSPHPPQGCPCLPEGRWCHGFHAATLDHRRIANWWGRHPEFGVGVACGPAGLVVIDIDAHGAELPSRDRLLPGIQIGDQVNLTGLENGFHTLAVLAALCGRQNPAEDGSTLRVRTPSGGLHVWYRTTDQRRWRCSSGSGRGAGLAWQVDVRAHGGYIVAPGTTTQDGTYTPIDDVREPAALPSWLVQELERTGHLPAATIPAPRPVPPRAQQAVEAAGGDRSSAQRLLVSVLAPIVVCGKVAEGAAFSETLNRAAYTLGGLIAAGRLTEEEAKIALTQAAVTARPGQERRVAQIIHSGLTAGQLHPLHMRRGN